MESNILDAESLPVAFSVSQQDTPQLFEDLNLILMEISIPRHQMEYVGLDIGSDYTSLISLRDGQRTNMISCTETPDLQGVCTFSHLSFTSYVAEKLGAGIRQLQNAQPGTAVIPQVSVRDPDHNNWEIFPVVRPGFASPNPNTRTVTGDVLEEGSVKIFCSRGLNVECYITNQQP